MIYCTCDLLPCLLPLGVLGASDVVDTLDAYTCRPAPGCSPKLAGYDRVMMGGSSASVGCLSEAPCPEKLARPHNWLNN